MAIPKITYLGHAGFMIETEHDLVIIDPWLSESGAFDYSWFQYPCNHHLADVVRDMVHRCTSTEGHKKVHVYISHEHRDHWDPEFLQTLGGRIPFENYYFPKFTRKFLQERYGKRATYFEDLERIEITDGYLEFYIHDSVRESDSAVLLHYQGFNFLNLNDCHIYDRIADIKERNGHIDILTGHFSGASWYPTCYSYCDVVKPKKAERVKLGRFNALARVIEKIQPSYYVPSAGPACFLDEASFDYNIPDSHSIFSHASEFYDFLRQRSTFEQTPTVFRYQDPGDVLLASIKVPPYKNWKDLQCELLAYRKRMEYQWGKRKIRQSSYRLYGLNQGLDALAVELQKKLDAFPLIDQITFDKLVCTTNIGSHLHVLVDFRKHTAKVVDDDISDVTIYQLYPDCKLYIMSAKLNNWYDLLWHTLTWYEFLLTMRVRLSRTPDEFDPLLDGFLVNQIEDLAAFCELHQKQHSEETILVHDDDKTYKVYRKCPHAGADLSNGWIENGHLVCPKHNWRFDLKNGGKCDMHDSTINAIEVTNDQHSSSQA